MNYAVAYLGGILIFAAIYWMVQGRKFYKGPIVEAEAHEEGPSSDEEMGSKKREDMNF